MFRSQITAFTRLSLCAIVFITTPAAARAQDAVDIPPVQSAGEDAFLVQNDDVTHPPLRLTPDRSELIRLDQEATSIIVGNPDHVSVLTDSTKTLVVVPKLPGATFFTVLNNKGEVIMQRHVIVASPKENYVRIRRACASGGDSACQDTSVFYCPDMCHKVNVPQEPKEDKNSFTLEDLAKANKAANDDAEGGSGDTNSAPQDSGQ